MSAERERAERLAAERYPGGSPESTFPLTEPHRRIFTEGYLASKVLTEGEWQVESDRASETLWEHFGEPGMPPDEFTCCADEVLTALGYTRTSGPGGGA